MTYILYSHDGSGGFVAEAALVKAGVDFEIIVTDTEQGAQMAPDFVALNPMNQVPALKLPDGTLMTESAAIAIYLAESFPDRGLAPVKDAAAHATFLRWMVFLSVNLYEGCLRYFYSERYTADAACADAVKQAGEDHVRRGLRILEDGVAPSGVLCGDELSIADVYLAMLMSWAPEPVTLPKLAAIAQAVADDETYGPLWRRHEL